MKKIPDLQLHAKRMQLFNCPSKSLILSGQYMPLGRIAPMF
jgi:hypothetical protein